MAAVTTDLRNVLVRGVPAMVAAIFLIAGYCARTTLVPAFVVIRHIILPCPLQILRLKNVAITALRRRRFISIAIEKL